MAISGCAAFGMISAMASLTLNVLSIASAHWLHSRYPGNGKENVHVPEYNIGIFRHCELADNFCGDMEMLDTMIKPSDIAWFRVIQATFIMAVVGTLLATIMSVFMVTKMFDPTKGGYKMLSVVQLLTLTAEMIALSLFGMDCTDMFAFDGHSVELAWAFYLAIAASAFIFVSVIFHAMEASRAVEVLKNVHHRISGLTSNYTLFVDQDI